MLRVTKLTDYATVVMTALARLPPPQGVAAMQSINVAAIRPSFMAALFGTAAGCFVLAVTSVPRWDEPGAALRLAGALLYLAGAVLVTAAFNVPRNDALAAVDPASAGAAALWARYVREWTVWNHVRAVASLAAAATLVLALR